MIQLLLVLITLIGLVATGAYFYFDITKHKDENVKDFAKVDKDITVEKKDRLSNLKYIVDQINTTHTEMDKDHLDKIDETYEKVETGFGSIIKTTDAENKVVTLGDLPHTPITNIELLNNVSAVGNLTVKDNVKVLGSGNCIELGGDVEGKEPDSGKLCYAKVSDGLDIIGAGPGRKVKVSDTLEVNKGVMKDVSVKNCVQLGEEGNQGSVCFTGGNIHIKGPNEVSKVIANGLETNVLTATDGVKSKNNICIDDVCLDKETLQKLVALANASTMETTTASGVSTEQPSSTELPTTETPGAEVLSAQVTEEPTVEGFISLRNEMPMFSTPIIRPPLSKAIDVF